MVRGGMSSRSLLAVLAFFTLSATAVSSARGENAPPVSPFLPPGKAQTTAEPPSADNLQLAGISVIGKKSFVSLYIPSTQRSRWIAVGTSVEGLEVLSCDPVAEQALVRVQGQTKLLTLRKAIVGSGTQPAPLASGVSPAAAPSSSQPAPPLTVQQEQEREARMLVSDLLDIGLQQRKAYEELQRKATAEEAAKKPSKP